MESAKEWKFCVVGNITTTHTDENGVLRYGTAAFPGGTKVYLCGKYWDGSRKSISVIGLNRGKRYQVVDTDVRRIENVRAQMVFKPSVLKIMNDWEFADHWWGRTAKDKKEAADFVRRWQEAFSP